MDKIKFIIEKNDNSKLKQSLKTARIHYYSNTNIDERIRRENSCGTKTTSDPLEYIQKFPQFRLEGIDSKISDNIFLERDIIEIEEFKEYGINLNEKHKIIPLLDEYDITEVEEGSFSMNNDDGGDGGLLYFNINWKENFISNITITVAKELRNKNIGSYLFRELVNYADELKLNFGNVNTLTKGIQSTPQDVQSPSQSALMNFYSSFSRKTHLVIIGSFIFRIFNP